VEIEGLLALLGSMFVSGFFLYLSQEPAAKPVVGCDGTAPEAHHSSDSKGACFVPASTVFLQRWYGGTAPEAHHAAVDLFAGTV
jgi:hypothetical protein